MKYEYKLNMNIMVGIFREELIDIISSSPIKRAIKMNNFFKKIKKYIIAEKPGRTYPRKRMHSMNKYRHNLRKNC